MQFPPLNHADPTGLIAIGGDLKVETLIQAYQSGIFPWPMEGMPLLWFAPPERGVLFFKDLHIPKRLARGLKKSPFTFAHNKNFSAVIKQCAASLNRGEQKGTWITPEMIKAYERFHQAGYAHSFEAYDAKGKLVGGMYGVRIKNYFAGESMFYLASDASKFAFLQAIEYLKGEGLTFIDVQMITPLTKSLGGKLIPRDKFMTLLRAGLR